MKQEDFEPKVLNEIIIACRTLTTEGTTDPAVQQRAALICLRGLEGKPMTLQHYESGEQFSVTFPDHDAGVEGSLIIKDGEAPPVGVKVEPVGTAAAPTTNIARMGAEDEPADDMRTGGQIADDIDPDRHTEAPADDGTVGDAPAEGERDA